MTYKIYPEQDIEDIAKAIRSRNGLSEKYTVSEMADAINNFDIYSLVGEDNAPYLYRQAPHLSSDYDRENDTIIGGTVVWNQLVPTAKKDFTNTVTDTRTKTMLYVRKSDTPYTVLYYTEIEKNFSGVKQTIFKANFTGFLGILHSGAISDIHVLTGSDNVVVQNGHVYAFNIDFISNDVTTVGGFHTDDLQLIDLTQMFGTDIANYAYQLEQTTAGSGITWLKSQGFLTEDYIPFNEGEIKSVSGLVSHDMVGFNQWDENTKSGYWNVRTGIYNTVSGQLCSKGYIHVEPNATYYAFNGATTNLGEILYYDENKKYMYYKNVSSWVNQIFTIPSDCHYITFNLGSSYGTIYNNDICINISDTNRNGEYEPYVKHSYPLDSSLTLRGILELDNNRIVYNGDKYHSDGDVDRYMVEQTLNGSEDWQKVSTNLTERAYFALTVGELNSVVDDVQISDKYLSANITLSTTDIGIRVFNSPSRNDARIAIRPENVADMTVTQFKELLANNPVTIVYKLATPTTEQAEPFSAIQICDPNGTEEYVTTGIPVGHETKYLKVVEI